MSIAQEVECLRKIPMFANVETSKLKLLAFTSERVTYKPGEVLFHQDEMGTCAFIILSGEAEVEVRTPAGPLPVAILGASEIVGEIAILCDVPRTATVRALSELDALCVPKDHVRGRALIVCETFDSPLTSHAVSSHDHSITSRMSLCIEFGALSNTA